MTDFFPHFFLLKYTLCIQNIPVKIQNILPKFIIEKITQKRFVFNQNIVDFNFF